MVDNTWLEQYRMELHSLRDAGDVRAIRKKNMELNNRLEYVKDEKEKNIFLTALYETEDVLREYRTEEKMRNGLTEYKGETTKDTSEEKRKEESELEMTSKPATSPAIEPEREALPIRERFIRESIRAAVWGITAPG